jgi:cation transport ATPase
VEIKIQEWEGQGKTVVLAALDSRDAAYQGKGKEKASFDARVEGLIGLVAISDTVKPEASATIRYLRSTRHLPFACRVVVLCRVT